MKSIVIGLGNPILQDDGVGNHVAKLLQKSYSLENVDIKEAYIGGISLIEAIVGYDKAIIVDASMTGKEPGTVSLFSIDDLLSTKNISSSHDTNLATAYQFGKTLGFHLPETIHIIGIEAKNINSFGEILSEEVKKSIPLVLSKIEELLQGQK